MSNIGVWVNAEPGARRKILNAGKHLMMMEVHFEANAEGYKHSHPHEQMTYCMKGTFEFVIGGRKHVLHAGDTLCIPGHAEHGCRALEAGILLDSFTPVREDLLNAKITS
ncbi:cupin domain-containing protein [Paenibacillus harenae]|uniref:Quercetin dioxygenase-like cupin family protein n=1 Tax=Paenibacillus harenae TaxID=306543 RepID=A0ABT9UCU7_PAEHA|nr:cupin domain-containing protein [Paenibacillus harenae]MDQ0116783.1 quercetin dioxygenase-like cupin family protein [Paenibacillus harenae]